MSKNSRQGRRWLHTDSVAWKRIRARQLAKEPTCRLCRERGLLTPATHVDHIDGKAACAHDYREENLQSLCQSCHSAKTAQEDGGFGKAKGEYRPNGYDVNGNPIDPSHHWNTHARQADPARSH